MNFLRTKILVPLSYLLPKIIIAMFGVGILAVGICICLWALHMIFTGRAG